MTPTENEAAVRLEAFLDQEQARADAWRKTTDAALHERRREDLRQEASLLDHDLSLAFSQEELNTLIWHTTFDWAAIERDSFNRHFAVWSELTYRGFTLRFLRHPTVQHNFRLEVKDTSDKQVDFNDLKDVRRYTIGALLNFRAQSQKEDTNG